MSQTLDLKHSSQFTFPYLPLLVYSNKSSTNVWRSNSESDLKDIFSKKSKSKNCDYPFSSRHKYAKQGKLSWEDKENAIKLFPISHRRRSWPPKEGSQDSGYLLFNDKENRDSSKRSCFSRDYFLNDDTDIENLLSEISKSEIRSRVRERIEDFENFKVCQRVLPFPYLNLILYLVRRETRFLPKRTLQTMA